MKKYKNYYYTTRKTIYGKYLWYIRNKYKCGELLQMANEPYDTKQGAEISAEEHIDEYYY